MKTGIKRALVVSIVSIVIAVIVFVGCAPTAKTQVTLYTGGTAGVYFPLGSKYAEMLNKYSDIIDASAVTSGAIVTNVKGIEKGESQAGLIQNDVSYYGHKGIFMFENPVPQLQGVATLYPETIQFVVRSESDIYTLADLERKNVAVGAPGSGTAVCCEQTLKAAGVWGTITRFDLAFAEAASALKLGQVDVGFLVAGYPTPAIEEIAVTIPVRIVSIPDDVVYNMTKILFEHLDELRTVHVKAEDITLDTALDGMSLVLHSGAIKYYEDKGIKVSTELKG